MLITSKRLCFSLMRVQTAINLTIKILNTNMKFFILSIITLFLFSNAILAQNDAKAAIIKYMEANQHYLKKEYNEAGNKYKAAFELNKANKAAAFNSACSYALANDIDNAVAMAQIAYEAGNYGFAEETDFDSIRSDERFAAIEAIATADIAATKEKGTDPVVVEPPIELLKMGNPRGLIVAVHGYGGAPETFQEPFKFAVDKYNVVLLCLRGSEINGKDAFHWNFSREEYMRIDSQINEAIIKYDVDPSRVILTGFSQGGFICYNFGLQKLDKFVGLMPIAGNFSNKNSVVEDASKGAKIYSLVGKSDKPSYLSSAEEAKKLLVKQEIEMKIVKYDGGHIIPDNHEELFSEAIEWFLPK